MVLLALWIVGDGDPRTIEGVPEEDNGSTKTHPLHVRGGLTVRVYSSITAKGGVTRVGATTG